MVYLVGCMSYTSFCVTKFAFVEVIKGCIMEIEYKQTKDFTADELQENVRSTEHGCKLYQ